MTRRLFASALFAAALFAVTGCGVGRGGNDQPEVQNELPISIKLVADGKAWNLYGGIRSDLPSLRQTDKTVRPLQTIYSFAEDSIKVRLVLSEAKLVDDLDVFSRPVTYVSVRVDGAAHTTIDVVVNASDMKMETCRTSDGDSLFVFARDNDKPVDFFGAKLKPWWRRDGMTFDKMFEKAVEEGNDIIRRIAEFDAGLVADIETTADRENLQRICEEYRRAHASCRLVADANNQPMFLSSGLDVRNEEYVAKAIAPIAPQLLFSSPTLARASIVPILLAGKGDTSFSIKDSDAVCIKAIIDALSSIEESTEFADCWRQPLERWTKNVAFPASDVVENLMIATNARLFAPLLRNRDVWRKYAAMDKTKTRLYAPLGVADAVDEGQAFNLASFNIRCPADKEDNAWSNRVPRVVKVIQKHAFDIFGVQEATPMQREDLDKALGAGWARIGLGRAPGDKGEAMCIYYKKSRFKCLADDTFWLSETPRVPGSKSWDAACTRNCTWGLFRDLRTNRTFRYFNTHLDHISPHARVMGMKVLLNEMVRVAQGETVFLTGDLNDSFERIPPDEQKKLLAGCGPRISTEITFEHPIFAASQTLFDTLFRTEKPHEGPLRTFSGYMPTNRARIDYIFATGDVRVLRHITCNDRPDGKFPSDHDAIMARLLITSTTGK